MNSKGQGKTFLVSAIILVAVISIVIIFLIRIGVLLGGDAELRLCQVSLAAQELSTAESILSPDSPLRANCIPRVLSVGDDTATAHPRSQPRRVEPVVVYLPNEQGELKPLTRYFGVTPDVANNILAESMRRCWVAGLEGKQPIFNDRSWTNKNVCLVCEQISFDTSTVLESTGENSLSSYLDEHEMPGDTEKNTYEEFLFTETEIPPKPFDGWAGERTVSGSRACLNTLSIEQNPPISQGTYATILIRRFGSFDSACLNTYVVPATQLRTLCDFVAN